MAKLIFLLLIFSGCALQPSGWLQSEVQLSERSAIMISENLDGSQTVEIKEPVCFVESPDQVKTHSVNLKSERKSVSFWALCLALIQIIFKF